MDLDLTGMVTKRKRGRPKSVRHEHDAYMTPANLVSAIVERCRHDFAINPSPSRIIEPSCGDGEFVTAMRACWPNSEIVAIDIRDEVRSKIEPIGRFVHADFLKIPESALAAADLILTNPPYSIITDFMEHALRGMRDGAILALLMRFGHLVGSRANQVRLREPLPNRLSILRQLIMLAPVHPRPSFTSGGGTDATEYTVGVWKKGHDNGGLFDAITWDKPTRERK